MATSRGGTGPADTRKGRGIHPGSHDSAAHARGPDTDRVTAAASKPAISSSVAIVRGRRPVNVADVRARVVASVRDRAAADQSADGKPPVSVSSLPSPVLFDPFDPRTNPNSKTVDRRRGRETADKTMTDFTGKHGLIVGVANKRSISWAIAQAVARRGARLALTYQGRFEEHVNDLSQGLEQPALVLPCDVSSDAEIASVFEKVDQEFGGLDFIVHGAAFAPREELEAPFVNTTRDGFRIAMDISAYSLIALTRAAMPLFEKRGGGSVVTLTYLGSQRVFPNYNVMGVAKAALEATVRYLAADVGPKGVRVNAVSAGPIKTLAAAGIKGFSNILHVYPERAPLRRNVEISEVAEASAFLLSDAGKGITGEVLMVDAGYHVTGM